MLSVQGDSCVISTMIREDERTGAFKFVVGNLESIDHLGYLDLDELSHYNVWLRAGRPGDPDSFPGRCERIFPLTSVSRPALRPTQPPVQ
jgi:hypothetical protein